MRLLSLVLLLFAASMLYSDVMYEMVSTTEGMMGMKGETQMRIFVKGDRSLTEITAENPMGGTMTAIKIIRLDKGVVWTIDHDRKEYTEQSLAATAEPPQASDQEAAIPEIKVVQTGEKKTILNKECEQIIVTMDVADDEGAMAFKQTMWVSKDIAGYQEVQDFQKKITELGFSASSAMKGPNRKDYEDFQKKISEIEGFPLEIDMEMTMTGQGMSMTFTTHSEVTKIEATPVSDKVFEIPAGYSLKQ